MVYYAGALREMRLPLQVFSVMLSFIFLIIVIWGQVFAYARSSNSRSPRGTRNPIRVLIVITLLRNDGYPVHALLP